jgi:hypothetical protein
MKWDQIIKTMSFLLITVCEIIALSTTADDIICSPNNHNNKTIYCFLEAK